jgi:hypothetical protein
MIQRKQTVYLFIAGILMLLTFFAPLARFIGETNSVALYIYKVVGLVPDIDTGLSPYFVIPLMTTVSLIVLLSFVAIFLYKKRMRQLLIVRFMLLLVMTYFGLYFFYYLNTLENLTGGFPTYDYGVNIPGSGIQIPMLVFVIPLLTAIMLFLASRGIIKDEKLVRSADRLR